MVPEQAPLIILYIKSAVCMAKNGKYTINNRQLPRRMNLVINSEG